MDIKHAKQLDLYYKLNKMDIFSSIMQTWNILRGGKSIERWLDTPTY